MDRDVAKAQMGRLFEMTSHAATMAVGTLATEVGHVGAQSVGTRSQERGHLLEHLGAEDFAAKAETEHGLNPAEVEALLQDARFKQSIVDAMTRPAEGKPWHEYRPIFLTDKRIKGGVEFWRENEELIAQASEKFGVDPEFIVAIIGVETRYGRITGSYRVLDALMTLAFDYPDPGDFAKGSQQWANNCARCHNIRSADELRDDQWITTMFHMRVRAGLTGEEMRNILTFLQTSNDTAVEKRIFKTSATWYPVMSQFI